MDHLGKLFILTEKSMFLIFWAPKMKIAVLYFCISYLFLGFISYELLIYQKHYENFMSTIRNNVSRLIWNILFRIVNCKISFFILSTYNNMQKIMVNIYLIFYYFCLVSNSSIKLLLLSIGVLKLWPSPMRSFSRYHVLWLTS